MLSASVGDIKTPRPDAYVSIVGLLPICQKLQCSCQVSRNPTKSRVRKGFGNQLAFLSISDVCQDAVYELVAGQFSREDLI